MQHIVSRLVPFPVTFLAFLGAGHGYSALAASLFLIDVVATIVAI